MNQGYIVQRPVVAYHETIKQEDDLSGDYKDWERMIEKMIVLLSKVLVLKLDGYIKIPKVYLVKLNWQISLIEMLNT